MPRNLFLKARHNEGADEKTSNLKYEITDSTHEEHPFLRRIRALRDVGDQVKVGDLGGFVESESNLATDPSDGAWIFDDAIAAGNAYVERDACLRGDAIASHPVRQLQGVWHGAGGYPHHRFCRDPALRGSPQRYKGYLCPERQEPERDPQHRA